MFKTLGIFEIKIVKILFVFGDSALCLNRGKSVSSKLKTF